MSVIVYNKLVRDRIPEIIAAQGKPHKTRVLEPDEYVAHLHTKLNEELKEYQEDGSISELADLLEVIYALSEEAGVPIEQLEAIRREKRLARGAFKNRLLLEYVVEPDSQS